MDRIKAAPRVVEGRHEGHSFTVEVHEDDGQQMSVHEVRVGGVAIASDHLPVESCMSAALQSGASLAREYIDASVRHDAGQVPLPAQRE